MQEVDTAADATTSPGSQSITLGSIVAGIFPADVSAEDGQVLQYREGRPSDTDHYPATQTLTTGSSCGGAFPTDLQTSDNVALCLREATSAGIAFDAASSTSGSQTTFSWTHTTSGSNRLLVVGIALRLNASQTVTSVTYAGTGLTFRRGDELAVSVRSEVWYLVNPALGPNTVDVTFSSSTKASIGAISLTGIDQTTPVDVSNGGTGNSAAPSTTMTTTANGAWAVDVVAFRSSGNGQPTGSPGAGQTERWSQYTEGGGGGSNIRGKGSTEGPVSPAGSITMDWTLAAAVEWSITAVAFRPVPVNNQMSVRHDWSSIPTNGDAYDLCVEAWVTNAGGESMLVQVLTPPATWNTRITVTKTSDDNADQCYTLTSGEFNVGAPSIRWIGGTESGDPTQSDLRIDRERVVRRFIFYTLDVRHDWTGVPSGNAYELVVTGRRGDEDVSVQVLTPPSTWNTRITIASGTSQRYTYALTGQEYNGGNPSVRFSDALGPEGVASDVYLDWVAIRTVNLQYVLEVYHNVTGISVSGISFLVVKGNVTAGGENFNVHVWNFTAAAWDLALAAPFTTTNAYHNVSLSPDHVAGGTARVRFVDAGAGDTVQGAVSLDYVAVAVVNGPAALTGNTVSPSSGNLATTFTFSVLYVDAENDPPAFVELVLNGTPYAMAETNPGDTTYTDGKDYEANLVVGTRGTFDYFFRTQAGGGDVSIATSSVLQVSVENRVPTITNPLPADGVHTRDSYVRGFTGSDPDGDSLTWSLATDAAWISMGPTNGTVWGQAPAAPIDVYVNVTVSDGYGGIAWNNYTLSVGNLAPAVTNPVTMDTVHTGRSYLRDFDATDPEGDALTWTLASDALWLFVGPANGTVWGLAPPVASVSYVNVTVADGFGGSAFTNYTLSVGNVAPAIANAIPTASTYRRTSFVHDFDATDPEGDALTWSLRTNASFLAIGTLNGTVFGLTGAMPGSYWVEVAASDGFGGVGLANFTLLVVNRAPQVTVDGARTGEAGAIYTATLSAVDPDGDAVTWTLATNASWLFFDPAGPTVTGTAAAGTYYVLVTARDPYGDSAAANFTIVVASAPPPPTSGNLPGILSYLALGVGAFAVAVVVVRRSRRSGIEQAFLLDESGTVRFAFNPPAAPLDEARLRALLARQEWRSAESIPADPPYTLHIVPQGVGMWLFVSRIKDGARVRRAASAIMSRAETSWATAPDRNT